MPRVKSFDIPLLICTLMLAGLGILFIYSASYPKALSSADSDYNGFYYVGHQIVFVLVGLALMVACMYIPLSFWRRIFPWIIGSAGGLLLVALIMSAKHGHQSYIQIGPVQFMPSEFAKIALVLSMATFLAKRPWTVRTWKGMWNGPYWFWLIPTGLIALEQDIGTMMVIGLALIPILHTAGTKLKFILLPLALAALLGGVLVISGHLPTRISDRVQAWVNPTDKTNQASYHPYHSLIAVGSGGLLGRGLCQSREKWLYLPACQNDYIFAIICEEMGFVGTILLLIVPFAFLFYRGLSIAHSAPDEYSALVAVGCITMLATPMFINIAMVLNCLPSVGINLPFISYGGSSIVVNLMLTGLLLNVSSLQGVDQRQVAPRPPLRPAPGMAR
jgi:cell division protein FtsW